MVYIFSYDIYFKIPYILWYNIYVSYDIQLFIWHVFRSHTFCDMTYILSCDTSLFNIELILSIKTLKQSKHVKINPLYLNIEEKKIYIIKMHFKTSVFKLEELYLHHPASIIIWMESMRGSRNWPCERILKPSILSVQVYSACLASVSYSQTPGSQTPASPTTSTTHRPLQATPPRRPARRRRQSTPYLHRRFHSLLCTHPRRQSTLYPSTWQRSFSLLNFFLSRPWYPSAGLLPIENDLVWPCKEGQHIWCRC